MNSTKLKGCAGRQCQALCCYDGVYLSSKDANRIHDALIKHPEFFIGMTKDYIVHSEWEGIVSGFKTATMPHEFKGSAPPKHFNKTRCVFVGDDNLCLLEVAARAVGSHKWAFKPTSCCLFPFALDSDGKIVPILTDG